MESSPSEEKTQLTLLISTNESDISNLKELRSEN
jgi:hypothetical protein